MRRSTLPLLAALFWTVWPQNTAASPQSDWQRFRAEYPYHIQTVALGAQERGATAEAASRVRALVEEFVTALRSLHSTDDLLAALREFVIQLKAIPGVKRVDTLQVQEAGDLIIVRQGGSESSHAAN